MEVCESANISKLVILSNHSLMFIVFIHIPECSLHFVNVLQ